MSNTAQSLTAFDDRLDRLVNLDLGQRGVEHLYAAARSKLGRSLVGAAADLLDRIAPGATVLMTSGSVTRSWISPHIGENDGPAGLAAIARALWLAKRAHLVVVAEETLHAPLASIMAVAGLTALPSEQAKIASSEGSLAAVTLQSFTTDTAAAPSAMFPLRTQQALPPPAGAIRVATRL